jgi:hypothetical protein
LEESVPISRRIAEVTEAVLLAAAVLMLVAAPVLFVLLFTPHTWVRGATLDGLHDFPALQPALSPCCVPGEADAAVAAPR